MKKPETFIINKIRQELKEVVQTETEAMTEAQDMRQLTLKQGAVLALRGVLGYLQELEDQLKNQKEDDAD